MTFATADQKEGALNVPIAIGVPDITPDARE
jgi:hypothetical protein